MDYGLTVLVPPAEEPVTLEEAKDWLRIDYDHAGQDARIARLIRQARERCERVTETSLVTQTLRLTLPWFPGGACSAEPIRLPRPPLAAVTSVVYLADDAAGTETTLSADDYEVNAGRLPGIVTPVDGKTWPGTYERSDAVRVTYTAGHGAASAVPAEFGERILTDVAYCFLKREEQDQAYLESLYKGLWCGAY